MSYLPKQRVSLRTREKNEKQHSKDTMNYYISQSNFKRSMGAVTYGRLYDYYNGKIFESDYKHILNPTNLPPEKLHGNPAELRNYPIIKPVVDLFMGEKRKRPRNFMVSCTNDDVEERRQQFIAAEVRKALEQDFINKVNAMGVETGVESQPVDIEQAVAEATAKYKDKRAIQGQSLLDYTFSHQKIPRKFQKGFFDYLITGEVYSYKDLDKGDVLYEIVAASDMDYAASEHEDMVEDTPWQVRRGRFLVSEIVDRHYDRMTENQRKMLESGAWNGTLKNTNFNIAQTDVHLNEGKGLGSSDYAWGENKNSLSTTVEVYHVVWTTEVKVGILDYIDEYGQQQQMEVDEDYKLDIDRGDISIEWIWLNRKMQGWRISDDFCFGIDFLPIERGELNNKSRSKSPYNGRCYSNRFSENISIVSLGIPYQKKVNEYNLSLDTTISKNNDMALLIDISVIPKGKGWDVDKFIYYLKKMGIAFINKSQDGADKSFNQYTALQMSTMQYVKNTYDLIQAFRDEYEELVGITKPRKGQNQSAGEGLGMMQSSIVSSSNITEELFARFDEFEESEAQGILDLVKWSNLEGKKGEYMTPDERMMFLQIEPETVQEAEYALFAKNSGEEREQLNMMKQQAVAFAQNAASPSTIAKMLMAKSMEKLAALMEEVEKSREAVMMQQQEAQNKAMVEAEAIKERVEAAKLASAELRTEMQGDASIEVALINNAMSVLTSDLASISEADRTAADSFIKDRELALKEADVRSKAQQKDKEIALKEKELELKREQMQADKYIARVNKN